MTNIIDVKKNKGRPLKTLDTLKVASLEASLLNAEEALSSSYLAQVSGLPKSDVMLWVKARLRSGLLIQQGTKKGAKYIQIKA